MDEEFIPAGREWNPTIVITADESMTIRDTLEAVHLRYIEIIRKLLRHLRGEIEITGELLLEVLDSTLLPCSARLGERALGDHATDGDEPKGDGRVNMHKV